VEEDEQVKNDKELKIIGKSERRVDAWGKVTGKAKYADDYNVSHQLIGKVLRSNIRMLKLSASIFRKRKNLQALRQY